jgi:hypothetical protein
MAKVKQIEYESWVVFEAARLSNPSLDRGRTLANIYSDMARRWLYIYGGAGRRVNVMGIFDKETGRYRKSGMKRGFEDVDGILPLDVGLKQKIGLKLAIEVKVNKDKQTPEQIKRQLEVESAGGVYVFFKTPEQFVLDIHTLLYSKFGVIINQAASTFLGTGLQP